MYDTSNFDADFTKMSPRFTPIGQQAMHQVNQAEFRGFSFVNTTYLQYAKHDTSSPDERPQASQIQQAIATDL